MSKRNRTPAPGSGGRARSAPVKVSKPFPWGTVLVSVVLAALLIGLVAYAFMNQGEGRRDLLKEDDKSFSGLRVVDDLSNKHVGGTLDYPGYPQRPPVGGDHNGAWQSCAVYTDEIAPEHAVHSLEHGAVWVTYKPDLPDDQVKTLTDLVERDPYRMLSPLPGQESPIVLNAWGRQMDVANADDDVVQRFMDVYTNGRQTPERGASCVGVTATGRTPQGGAGQAPPDLTEPVPSDAPAGDAPAGDAPAGDAPAGDAPAGDAPADQAPAPAPTG